MRLVVDPRKRPNARRVFSPTNSVVECTAGPFVECVERIWEAKLGEYLSASDARRHLWHACLASGHSTFQPRSAAAAKRRSRETFVRPPDLRTRKGARGPSIR